MEIERTTSNHTSYEDKVYEELLEVVTWAVARLKLDWPQEQETSKPPKLGDSFLSGDKKEGPQRLSLPFFGDLHDESCLCALNVNLFDYRGCNGTGLLDDAPGGSGVHGLSLP